MNATAATELDREVFREVIGHFTSGVTVITATSEGRDYGMTASAVTSLSLEPPMMLVCLNNRSPTQEAITRSRAFAVSVLAEGQHELAKRFGRKAQDKFAGVPITRGAGRLPLIGDALAVLECEVSDDIVGGTHRVFLARVLRAVARPGSPLAYFRGSFGRVELDLNARALELVRECVITRRHVLDRPLDVGSLANELEIPPQLAYQALLTLTAEGLVSRRGERELVVTPVDRRSMRAGVARAHCHRARCRRGDGGSRLCRPAARPAGARMGHRRTEHRRTAGRRRRVRSKRTRRSTSTSSVSRTATAWSTPTGA